MKRLFYTVIEVLEMEAMLYYKRDFENRGGQIDWADSSHFEYFQKRKMIVDRTRTKCFVEQVFEYFLWANKSEELE